jgi:hypothetical protein
MAAAQRDVCVERAECIIAAAQLAPKHGPLAEQVCEK